MGNPLDIFIYKDQNEFKQHN